MKRCFSTITKKLKIGDKESIKKTFTEQDLIKFSELSFDTNPLHFSDSFAKQQVNYFFLNI
jgi:3-hydroxybutyryl-CoA dehydratase